MKKPILIIVGLGILIALAPNTAEARWHYGIWIGDCDCYWGIPDPWDPWWECPCYWDVWVWCSWHPYWMWPWWCRRWVDYHYSPCGRYYYVYYDYYVPGCNRVYIDGRYRYRYAVEMDRSYSITERIPRRRGLENTGGMPMPEQVSRSLESLGPEYRIKTTAQHAQENVTVGSMRNSPSVSSASNRSSVAQNEPSSTYTSRSARLPSTENSIPIATEIPESNRAPSNKSNINEPKEGDSSPADASSEIRTKTVPITNTRSRNIEEKPTQRSSSSQSMMSAPTTRSSSRSSVRSSSRSAGSRNLSRGAVSSRSPGRSSARSR